MFWPQFPSFHYRVALPARYAGAQRRDFWSMKPKKVDKLLVILLNILRKVAKIDIAEKQSK